MRYTVLGRGGLRVSSIGQGTGQFGTPAWGFGTTFTKRDITETVDAAIGCGINLFDTAETYGDGQSEELLGECLRKYRRDDFIVVSKVAPWNLRYENVLKAADRSLERLGLKYIDLYLVHYPNPFIRANETFAALERLVRQGKVKHIGTSNYRPIQLDMAAQSLRSAELSVNEIEYNVVSRFSEKYTIPYCLKNNIGVIAFSPLAGGVLTGRYSSRSPPRDRARAFNFLSNTGFIQKLEQLLRVLKDIAEQQNASISQVALAWIASHRGCVPIPASLNPAEAVENATAADLSLSYTDLEKIDQATPKVGLARYALDHYAIRPISWTKEAVRHYRSW